MPADLYNHCLDSAESVMADARKAGILNGVTDPAYATLCLTGALYTLGAVVAQMGDFICRTLEDSNAR